ncbi:MAG: universal stress protein [Desulfomonilaceae bacterium]
MAKRVLVTVDVDSVSEASIEYGVQLAARTKSSLVLLAISASRKKRGDGAAKVFPTDMARKADRWLTKALGCSQRSDVHMEIFFASGPFLDEVTRFVKSQVGIQFIVMAPPASGGNQSTGSYRATLHRLHEEFEGEILLVEKAGAILSVSDSYLRSLDGETSQ